MARAIEAEDTLKMIQEALEIPADLDKKKKSPRKASKSPRGKKTARGKKVAKKKTVDTVARFFNNHSENPHLQAIENGYLKHLSAQYAKETHLKEVRKWHIMHALRVIQRFWRKKLVEIKDKSAVIIQRYVRKFLRKLKAKECELTKIRKRL